MLGIRLNIMKRRRRAYKKLMKRKRIHARVQSGLAKRRRSEKRFQWYGRFSVGLCCVFLIVLLTNIFSNGYSAFIRSEINLSIYFDKHIIESELYTKLIKDALKQHFPDVKGRGAERELTELISQDASYHLQDMINEHPDWIGTTQSIWLVAASDADMFIRRYMGTAREASSRLSVAQQGWIKDLAQKKLVVQRFNTGFFTQGDSREPELAGILGALVGSFFVIISCMLLAFPLGVLTAIYLEEFAPKNRWTEIIEVNINNLAAVPSIVFGLLGLALYIQFIGIPRSAPLAGGLTLALMALPVMVIATRTSIRAIPNSIRDGAMAIGASKLQTTIHHVLPLAMPGIMTGTILSIARVLGETAPLLMIGMVAFVVDIPHSWLEASTAMPVQIYLWSDSAEPGFVEKTSAAIIVLLGLLVMANALAVYLRKKFEVRW